MAKRQLHKRVIGKDGNVRYFKLKKDSRGVEVYKRVSDTEGSKAYIKKNYDNVKKDSTKLTNKEKSSFNRSKAQKSLFRFDGKAIPKKVTDFLINEKFLNKKTPKELKKANLKNIKRPSDVEALLKKAMKSKKNEGFAEPKYGNSGYRNRERVENLVSLREEISPWLDGGYQFVVYQLGDSTPAYGDAGFQAIKRFETMTYKREFADKSSAFIRFIYRFRVDEKTRLVEVYLSEAQFEVGQSDPIKRTKK
jgi:hypothetical protein